MIGATFRTSGYIIIYNEIQIKIWKNQKLFEDVQETDIGPVLSTVLGPILAKIRPKTGLNTKNRFIKQS